MREKQQHTDINCNTEILKSCNFKLKKLYAEAGREWLIIHFTCVNLVWLLTDLFLRHCSVGTVVHAVIAAISWLFNNTASFGYTSNALMFRWLVGHDSQKGGSVAAIITTHYRIYHVIDHNLYHRHIHHYNCHRNVLYSISVFPLCHIQLSRVTVPIMIHYTHSFN